MKGAVRPVLLGRVYYDGRSYEARSPIDAVFLIELLGAGRPYAMLAHGRITMRAYGMIARLLRDDWGVLRVSEERHGHRVDIDVGRASDFGDP